jgi:hypothetical protein
MRRTIKPQNEQTKTYKTLIGFEEQTDFSNPQEIDTYQSLVMAAYRTDEITYDQYNDLTCRIADMCEVFCPNY